MSPERLVPMAHQIALYFASQHRADSVQGIADHLRKFWDPRMRHAIIAYAAKGGEGLDPEVLQAVRTLGQ